MIDNEDLIQRCIEVIRSENKASVVLLQRRLRLGYARASEIMDELELRGIVGPSKGVEPRDVLSEQKPVECLLKFISNVRFALGDDGKRMQDDFVEYCKALKKERDELQSQLNHVDAVLKNRDALDGIENRVDKILHAISCAKESDRLRNQLDSATIYAQNLTARCASKHWKEESPNFKPFNDISGLLSQLDNMIAGMVKSKTNTLENQIQLAAKTLPDSWEINITIQKGFGQVIVVCPDGSCREIDDGESDISEQFSNAMCLVRDELEADKKQ